MKKNLIIIILICNFSMSAQTGTGDIQTYLDNFITNVPGSSGNDYSQPINAELDAWETIIDFILEEDITSARNIANTLNYKITAFTDNTLSPNELFYILEEKSAKVKYWGTFVFSASPKRGNLILQAPHIKNDVNTGSQAVFCFKNNLAKALFLSGTHRCNHSSFSPCSGTTQTCNNAGEPYRISDMAHNVQSVFQRTTEKLYNDIPNSVFIQLHGFGKKSTDPSLIISNGTREKPAIDYAIKLKNALINEDNSLDAELPHLNTNWNRLIAFTNPQGRFSNFSTDACSDSAEGTTGRFIHVEQELIKLRINSIGWLKMSNALKNVFFEDTDGDLVEASLDPDDNDACNPDPNNGNCNACSDVIFFDDFESGLGIWNDGGVHAFNSTLNALGDKSIRLKYGNQNNNPVDVDSSIFTDPIDFSTYDNIKIELSYITPTDESYDPGDKFFLEVSTDNGNNFSIEKTWEFGVDFDQDLRYFDSVILDGPFAQNTILRIRSFSNNDSDRIWVDNVRISSCDSALLNTVDFNLTNDFKVFPNPTSGKISISGKHTIQSIEVYNIMGQRVFSQKYNSSSNAKTIYLDNEKRGVYFLIIGTNKNRISRKLIIK